MKVQRKKWLFAFLVLLITAVVILIATNQRDKSTPITATGSAHLMYVYGEVKSVGEESIVLRVSQEITEEEFYPKAGETLYLFVPLKSMQEDVISTFSVGDEVSVSIYDLDNIHMDNGLYTIVIMSANQIYKLE